MVDPKDVKAGARGMTGKPANRDTQGRFPKGVSGNPTGRPKALAEMIAEARKHTLTAITALAEIAEQRKHLPAAATAAQALLDRGWGKPVQPLDGDGEGGPVKLVVTWERGED